MLRRPFTILAKAWTILANARKVSLFWRGLELFWYFEFKILNINKKAVARLNVVPPPGYPFFRCSLTHIPSIRAHQTARHERVFIRQEEGDHRRDFLGPADAAHRLNGIEGVKHLGFVGGVQR